MEVQEEAATEAAVVGVGVVVSGVPSVVGAAGVGGS